MGGRSRGPQWWRAVLVVPVVLAAAGVPAAAQLPPLTTPSTLLPPVSLPVDLPGVTVPPIAVPGVALPPVTLPPVTLPGALTTPPPDAPLVSPGGALDKTLSTGGAEPHRSTATGAGTADPAPAVAPLDAAGGAGNSGPPAVSGPAAPDRPRLRLRQAAAEAAQDLSFPMGLALAIAVFLLVQHRVDRGDPRVASGGVLRDDDLVGFS